MKSIQTKLTVIVLLIFLVAMSILGGLNYWRARSIITEEITTSMQKEAVNSAQDMNEWLKSRKLELTMLASNPVMQGGSLQEIMPVLAAAQNTNKAYEGIVYADRYGMSCSATGFKVSVADKLFFKHAMQGESFIADPATSRQTGKLIATVAVPVKSNGVVVGVLFGPMSMEELTKKVLNIKVGQTGYAYVLQADGLAIFHPDQEIAMKYNALKDEKTSPIMRSLLIQ
ncbi:cache domain-containing protein [Sporomusa acidovorans]|uniref:Cache domain-containing protein n=1 Tax=Sporomusa acidovorans (strain ATCC 49682 / DSM 3132 / Mol) TaxID=1123286 RepID=A0ABZ3J651_SPOA4|nr:cache domain-containing protein [Sporomusa acidovorans]OZC21015.1 methyl-accepting chemotaxis protein PctA [Sporomusa acidovorans DSM 3132]SDF18365.1 Cache domain-containing protein [Sporomusa acidovorans]